jgi:hypothetical protein
MYLFHPIKIEDLRQKPVPWQERVRMCIIVAVRSKCGATDTLLSTSYSFKALPKNLDKVKTR